MALNVLGVEREVALTIPHFAAAPGVVVASDLVVTVPRKLVEMYVHQRMVGVLIPFDVPALKLALYWHERSQEDPASRLLRNVFIKLFSDHTPVRPSRARGPSRGNVKR